MKKIFSLIVCAVLLLSDLFAQPAAKSSADEANARKTAFISVFEKEGLSPAEIDKGYEAWLVKFPDPLPDKDYISLYDKALGKLLLIHGKAGNKQQVAHYLEKAAAKRNFFSIVSEASSGLMEEKKWEMNKTILEKALKATGQTTTDQNKKKGTDFYKNHFAGMLGRTLFELGDTDRAVELLQMAMQQKQPFAEWGEANLMVLSKALAKQGKPLDAFLMLQQYALENNNNATITSELKSLYTTLNKGKGDFPAFLQSLNARIKAEKQRGLKEHMIREEAPLFSLKDIEGKIVSLNELKGKVVVLDFWATWCGPCKASFPGMKAAVTKYKDDKDVVFLFIDVWEREENYADMVAKFINDHQYPFHVLFDDMVNKDKATAKAYGVTGIPTQVVIDKNGFIRFKSSGGESNIEKLVTEMEAKIELAKKG